MSGIIMPTETDMLKPIATSTGNLEQDTPVAKCCCCRELPCVKYLWTEHIWMGQSEMYGQMIQECFNISWPKDDKSSYQICEVCITQLRNALQFKRRMEHNYAILIVPEDAPSFKDELLEPIIEVTDALALTGTEVAPIFKEESPEATDGVSNGLALTGGVTSENYAFADVLHEDTGNKDQQDTSNDGSRLVAVTCVKTKDSEKGTHDDGISHNSGKEKSLQKGNVENHKKGKDKKSKKSRRCQIASSDSHEARAEAVTSKSHSKDNRTRISCNSVVETRYDGVPSCVKHSEDSKKEAGGQTNDILLRSDEVMTSPRITRSCTIPSVNAITHGLSHGSDNVSYSQINCLNSEFFEQIKKEAAKQAKAVLFQNNASLTSPKLTRLCLIPALNNSPSSSPQNARVIPSSSYLKCLEKDLLEQIRKLAVEQTKSIIFQNSGAMTSPMLSRYCLMPRRHNSMHVLSQESTDSSPHYIECVERELFERIRKLATEQTKAMIVRNVEAMTSPKYTRSCFKHSVSNSMRSNLDCFKLECYTDNSSDSVAD